MQVKICGITSSEAAVSAASLGATYVGFVFFEKSPRNLTAVEAQRIAWEVPPGIIKVGLFVDPSNDDLDAILDVVPLDMIQLHGAEPPARVTEVKNRYGLPVMKAIGIRTAQDLPEIDLYASAADQLLIDAKPPRGAELPGGNGLAFDWTLLQGRRWEKPWMLAGGLTPANAARAANLTGAQQLDVSSGVETAPGIKDRSLMRAFLAAAGSEKTGAV